MKRWYLRRTFGNDKEYAGPGIANPLFWSEDRREPVSFLSSKAAHRARRAHLALCDACTAESLKVVRVGS